MELIMSKDMDILMRNIATELYSISVAVMNNISLIAIKMDETIN